MILGLFFAISACFVWGLIFVIPDFLADFTAVEVVLGRYLSYGILSSFLLFRKGFSLFRSYSWQMWITALIFALMSNIFYYFGVVAGLRYVTSPVTVLIIGIAPIVIALYGNWHVREISYKMLIIPCLWMAFGIILVNVVDVDWTFSSASIQQYLLGLLAVVTALVAWSWYAVHNARFLKRNPHIPSSEWTTVIGFGTLVWTIILAFIFIFGIQKEVEIAKFAHFTSANLRFLVGVVVLGVVCSWLGCFLWNRASLYLPVSMMGPFLIFETLFGLSFVYLVDFRLPNLMESLGVATMLSGVGLTIYVFRRNQYKYQEFSDLQKIEVIEKDEEPKDQ